ncbi:TetR/AcrR family transcriptional regulator [Pseudogemmobacter hezensis]|uniref:TetR/AcrR family transcriptional regulator n=1 Tax=Pseudogemmobacter hezensis TaxID=2737662 RepID=UPI00345A0F26
MPPAARPAAPPAASPAATRRHAAGADPQKRHQILEGAWQEFCTHGFDAATMARISRAAGVSKGTLYVYFQNKEDLFVALVEQRREQLALALGEALAVPGGIDLQLKAYALALSRVLTSDEMLRAQRIVVSVAERMPDLARRFHEAGARQVLNRLSRWLAEASAAGLMQIPDPELAAQQFTELSLAGIWRQRLFGVRRVPPDAAESEAQAASAVQLFLAAYGRSTGAEPANACP